VNTDSRKWGKSVHVQQESLFTFDRNGCSRWAGIGVQLAREYAAGFQVVFPYIENKLSFECYNGKPRHH